MKTFKQYIGDIKTDAFFGIPLTPESYKYNYEDMRDQWIHQLREIRLLKKENRKLNERIEELEFNAMQDIGVIKRLLG